MSDGVNGKVNGSGEFGQLLAGFRFGRGLSQEELADRSGMSVRAIRSLEHGQVGRPRWASVSLLAQRGQLAMTAAPVVSSAPARSTAPTLLSVFPADHYPGLPMPRERTCRRTAPGPRATSNGPTIHCPVRDRLV